MIASAKLASVKTGEEPSQEISSEVSELVRRAISKLRSAVNLGYDNVDQLEKDPDFAAIREREEFREVVKGLKEGTKK